MLSSLMKILEWHKVSELKHSQMELKSSQPPIHFFKWKKSCYLHSRVLWWNEFEFMGIKNESLGKSFYSLSFNFQKVSNFTQFHTSNHTTIKQTIKNYLFNITFQNLEFWDVTNLPPLKWISSSRFGEASKKRLGFGGLLKSINCLRGLGCYHP